MTFKFFSATFLISWALFIAAARAPAYNRVYFVVAIFTPALVAIWLTGTSGGTGALRALLARVLTWRVGLRWYVFALGFFLAIRFGAALIFRFATGTWPALTHGPWLAYALSILVGVMITSGEEIGWRGYALPRLGARFGFGPGSLVLGVLWALWHFPLFLILPGTGNYGQSFPLFLIGTTALSVAFGWLFVHTKGSVLLAMLMHSAVNTTHEIVQSGFAIVGPWALNTTLIAWLTLLLLWVSAAYFLIRMRRMRTPAPAA